jgi:hypothetical protein
MPTPPDIPAAPQVLRKDGPGDRPQGLALARDTLTNLDFLSRLTPDQRADFVNLARSILRMDLDRRLGRDPAAAAPPQSAGGALVIIPLALWQAGPGARRVARKPRLTIQPPTPGDAA